MNKCYVVYEEHGEYSDYTKNNIKAFLFEDDAKAYVEKLESEVEAKRLDYAERETKMHKMWPHGWGKDSSGKWLPRDKQDEQWKQYNLDYQEVFKDASYIGYGTSYNYEELDLDPGKSEIIVN